MSPLANSYSSNEEASPRISPDKDVLISHNIYLVGSQNNTGKAVLLDIQTQHLNNTLQNGSKIRGHYTTTKFYYCISMVTRQ